MKMYQVPESDLRYLIECRAKLEALEAGGVDNWSWYSDSISDYLEDYFSKNDSKWWEENDPDFSDIAEEQIQFYKEVKVDAE